MDNNQTIIKLRKASQNSIPSEEFKSTLLNKLDKELELKKPKLNFNTLFMNKKLMLFATLLFFVAVISTGGIAGYLLLQDSAKSEKFIVLSAAQKQSVLRNVIANNSQAALTSNNLSANSSNQEAATDYAATSPSIANDSSASSPAPSKLSAPGTLIAPSKDPNTYSYTKTKIKYGPKISDCKGYIFSDTTKIVTSESYEFYFDNFKYFNKSFSKRGKDLEYYYINKSYPEKSETIEYLGGDYAIKTTYNFENSLAIDPLAVQAPESDSASSSDTTSIEDQIRNLFGPDVEILKPENDDSYYVVEYSIAFNCSDEAPILYDVRTNSDSDTLITRNFIKTKDFRIYKTENYLNKVSKENLLDSTEIDSETETKDFSDVSKNFDFDYNVPVKEEVINSFNSYNNVDTIKEETVTFLDLKDIKLIVPVTDFESSSLYAPNAVITKLERGLESYEYLNLRKSREYYPDNSFGDDLYSKYLESFNGAEQILSYNFYNSNSSLNFEIYKSDIDVESFVKSLTGDISSDKITKSEITIQVDGKDITVDSYEYSYDYGTPVTLDAPSVDGTDPMPVEPTCIIGGCVTTQRINMFKFGNYIYKVDYSDYSELINTNELKITNFKSIDSKNSLDKAVIEKLIDNAYANAPIPTEPFPGDIGSVACTMDAMICPDGSAVGRNPANNCEFDPCP